MSDFASCTRWALPTLVLLALGARSALAEPIAGERSPAKAVTAPRPVLLSERDLVSGGESAAMPAEAWRPGDSGDATRTIDGALPDFVNAPFGETRDGLGLFDSLRGLATIAPAAQAAGRASAARTPGQPRTPFAGADLPEARVWMQDTLRGIVDSMLELEVDERGRVSFSVLGMGEFGIAVSGDRSQIALLSGDHVLLRAQRAADPAGGGHVPGAGQDDAGGSWNPRAPKATAPVGWSEASPFRKALELVFEIAAHPLSLLVYLIIAAYILLWNLLNRKTHRRRRRAVRQASAFSSAAPARRSRRRRHRVRRHRLA